ncbi:MAG: tRNA (guanosine(46)-N7)-methyltransferase TrmB [Bacteroidetes bacterium RIFCSPHIGHO2_02_FULL_44_7]|nr:MAG: tRNA (guanosine(46)-N7)-methyltransferase TrmB [Bacteroidetes bacterium RIFCSPHIGHO2_02_FULL_44_7]
MGKDKLMRFAAVKEFRNFYEPVLNQEFPLKGNWKAGHFRNEHPIVLELGCGKGEYSVGLAKHFPEKNFIGVDIKGSRMFIGARQALEESIENVAFLRTRIDFIEDYISEGEVDEIWLTFSDPQPKKPKKRLTSPQFIQRYRSILRTGGVVHLKTDSDLLFAYTEAQIKEQGYECLELTWDLYGDLPENIDAKTREIFHIKTHYEQLFTQKGAVIKYCRFRIH